MPKKQHRFEGESRFAKMVGIHYRTLQRCRLRGVINPDAFVGLRPIYLATQKRVRAVKRAIAKHHKLSVNKKYSLSHGLLKRRSWKGGVLGAEELDRHCEVAKYGGYQHIHNSNARETDTDISALRMTQGGGSDGPNRMARTHKLLRTFR